MFEKKITKLTSSEDDRDKQKKQTEQVANKMEKMDTRENLNEKESESETEFEYYTRNRLQVEFNLPKENEVGEPQNVMIETAVSMLQGKERVNRKDFEFAKEYLRALVEPIDDSSIDEITRFDSHIDHESTKKIQDLIDPQSEQESILTKQRNILGITGNQNEKSFEVRVLDVENKNWQKTTGAPTMFMVRDVKDLGKDVAPVIFLSKEQAKELIEGDPEKRYLQNALEHEYRHTQRSFSSENNNLFRVLDEACTNAGSYGYLRHYLEILCATTEDLSLEEIQSAYEKDDDEKKATVLKKWKKSFGDKGLLLLGALPSSKHTGDKDGLPNLPLIENDELDKYDGLHFTETLLSLRATQDSKWTDKLEKNIDNLTVPKGKTLRGKLEVMRGMTLTRFLNGLDDVPCENTEKLKDLIDAKIKFKEISGEAGLNDQL